VLGATRDGLAEAKEPVGKSPERYKLVRPGTIFYNPMRILLGSIALLDDGEDPGITSPDYVVFRPKPGVVNTRWLYYWLRSADGAAVIRTLARGAVRERMLFARLAGAKVAIPDYRQQERFAAHIPWVKWAQTAAEEQRNAVCQVLQSHADTFFGASHSRGWPHRNLGEISEVVGGLQKSP
jgi:type I restriction enzyme S subunit